QALADGLGAPLVGRAGFDAAAVPLVVAQRALSGDAAWSALQAAVARDGTGLVFVLEHAADDTAAAPGAADVIGVLSDAGPRRAAMSGKAIVASQFDRAADLISLEDYMRRILMSPFREVQVEVPVRMDDGRIEVFTGYRIQHNGARGPCKGGIRYHPDADHD